MNTHAETALKALGQMKGDDTYRAQAAFRGMTPKQMDEQFGQSGKTRREILACYQEHDQRIDAAIAWVRAAASMKS